jgi:hypothetical protein
MFEVKNDASRRLYRVRMSGFMRPVEMAQAAAQLIAMTESYDGKEHMCLADMRGLKALEPESARLLREAIMHTRQKGVVRCAHVSDSTISRLQAIKLASQPSTEDDGATVDCSSVEEAERVLLEYRTEHFK